jgi:protein gp37
MKFTGIQWTHSTINPTSGCDGCELYQRPPARLTTVEELKEWLSRQPCYAAQVHENRWAKSLAVTHPEFYAKHFYELRTIPGRMAEAAAWGPVTDKEAKDKPWFITRRRHIFVSDMSDALSRDVPFEFLKAEIIDVVTSEKGRRHIWQWLTKRPQRMREFDSWLAGQGIAWPENLWAGTSVTSQRTADIRVPELLHVRAATRFLSCEPLFEAVDLERIEFCKHTRQSCLTPTYMGSPHSHDAKIAWVIVGGASGRDAAQFNLCWARSIVAHCKAAGVPCFVKQLGARPVHPVQRERTHTNFAYSNPPHIDPLKLKDSHGGDWSEWPDDLRVRQMPEVRA